MLTELKAIFEKVDSEILNEQAWTKISKLVEESVDKKVSDRVQLELEAALTEQNEKHGKMFQHAINTIDEDHTSKIKLAVESLNKKHIEALNILKEKYEKIIKDTAVKHRDSLVEAIDHFLDEEVIEKRFPKIEIMEAAKNNHTSQILAEARKALGVDEKFIKQNIKTALVDGKKQIDTLAKENHDLKQKQLALESQRLVAEHTKHLPADAAKFVRDRFKNKPPQFIKENFKYVIDMYTRNEKNAKRVTLNENKSFVDRAKVADEIVKENTEIVNSNTGSSSKSLGDVYMEAMKFRK